MLNEQDNMVAEWKKQLYYEHNRDTSLRTSTTCRCLSWLSCIFINARRSGTDIFAQVILNIDRAFQCEQILARLSNTSEWVVRKTVVHILTFSSLVPTRNVNYGNNWEWNVSDRHDEDECMCVFDRFRPSIHLCVQFELCSGVDWARSQCVEWSTLLSISNAELIQSTPFSDDSGGWHSSNV